ncbi:MAG: hypothetical protein EA387_13420 [Nitriliruptor sp.]|nr:MAG: hypothetical protein EA387_13420 [Nitriliruptor sp.]
MRARPLLPAIRTRRAVRWLVLLPLLLAAIGCGVDEDPPPEPVPPVAEPDDPAAEPDEPSLDPAPETVEVEIYLSNHTLGDPCTEVFPVPRTVAADDPLTGALEALLAGPTDAERDEDYWSWFSDETEGMLRSVEIVAGTVMVDLEDLRPVIPNASTSCGSSILLSQLDTTTLAAAEGAASVLYLIEGEHDVFYEWLQLVPPGQDPPDDDASGTDTDLADGRHAVLLHAADLPGRTLTVDVIQFLTGEEARIAHAEDHPEDPHGPPNGYHIRNVNPRLRTLPVATDTEVILIQLDADPAEVASSWEALLDDLASQPGDHDLVSYNPFWLTLEGGVVTRIEEQFVP